MSARILMMFSIMILELGLGIASLLGVSSNYYGPMNEGGIAACVMIVVGILVSWLLTVAWFVRQSSRAKAGRIVEDAKLEAARVMGEAMDKAMALCSLDAGRCKQCGNPRTGKFCPKCGNPGEMARA